MYSQDKELVNQALDHIYPMYTQFGDLFPFHNYAFINENVEVFREMAKAEGLDKELRVPALLAIIFKDVGIPDAPEPDLNNRHIIDEFIRTFKPSDHIQSALLEHLDYLRHPGTPKDLLEQVLQDSVNVHLAFPDALERSNLLRIEKEKLDGRTYGEVEWLEKAKSYFLAHHFYTRHARKTYGVQRSKNYFELEKRLDKALNDDRKQKRNSDQAGLPVMLSTKETEDLFKTAFRNYVDLVSVADRKAGLLIQVNSILSSVIIAYTIRHLEAIPLYILPTAAILLTALVTIFFAISASRPQENAYNLDKFKDSESFFFGSFDRVDKAFSGISWDSYVASVANVFSGNKEEVFLQITRETFQVRRVLSKKFGYLSIAYKVFIGGLISSVISFLIVSLYISLHVATK